jgi:hypothetical protein
MLKVRIISPNGSNDKKATALKKFGRRGEKSQSNSEAEGGHRPPAPGQYEQSTAP